MMAAEAREPARAIPVAGYCPVPAGIRQEVRRMPEVDDSKGYLPLINTFVLTSTGSCSNLLFYKESDILKPVAPRKRRRAQPRSAGSRRADRKRDAAPYLKNNKAEGVDRATGWNSYRPRVCTGGDEQLFLRLCLRAATRPIASIPRIHATSQAVTGRTCRQVTP